jgi:hypothetical protein
MSSQSPSGSPRLTVARTGYPSVSFVLPAFNEEENIEKAVADTVAVAERHCSVYEVIVVDDGSTDRTAELVSECMDRHSQVRLVRHASNQGYGQALRSGFAAAELDYVFATDADNQFDMNELPLLLGWADQADVVAGFRRVRQDPFIRRANAWAWNRLVRTLFCVPVRDVDCAFKLYRREALAAVDIETGGAMIATEIMVKLARRGAAIVEVGVTHLPRTAGTPTGANVRVIVRALRELWRIYPTLTHLDPGAPPLNREPAASTDRPLEFAPEPQEAAV